MAESTSANPYAHNVPLEVLRTAAEKAPFENMVWIPGGTFLMGSDHHYLEEAPVHSVKVSGFWMDTMLVTIAKFRKFVEETDYLTVAERVPDCVALVHGAALESVPTRPARSLRSRRTPVPGASAGCP